jgi:hypothetical protein
VTGPKMIIDQVVAAERIVADAVQQMNGVSQQLQAQVGLTEVAMKAPAGVTTRANYQEHSHQGQVLAETLDQLQQDLALTRTTLLAGSDQATQVARGVATGGAGGIASQM